MDNSQLRHPAIVSNAQLRSSQSVGSQFLDDQVLVDRLKQEDAADLVPPPLATSPDRAEATWFRLVTAIASCYVFVRLHTVLEPCRFEVAANGHARCYLAEELQWELALPAAAYEQFDVVVRLWRAGALPHCLQVDSMRLGEPRRLPSRRRSVDVLPAVHPKRWTRTLAHR